ncbi:hypothetical protein ACWDA3_27005 [Nonomuraea rubra]
MPKAAVDYVAGQVMVDPGGWGRAGRVAGGQELSAGVHRRGAAGRARFERELCLHVLNGSSADSARSLWEPATAEASLRRPVADENGIIARASDELCVIVSR